VTILYSKITNNVWCIHYVHILNRSISYHIIYTTFVCVYLRFTCIRNDTYNIGLSWGKSFKTFIHEGNLNIGFVAIRLGIKRRPSPPLEFTERHRVCGHPFQTIIYEYIFLDNPTGIVFYSFQRYCEKKN